MEKMFFFKFVKKRGQFQLITHKLKILQTICMISFLYMWAAMEFSEVWKEDLNNAQIYSYNHATFKLYQSFLW